MNLPLHFNKNWEYCFRLSGCLYSKHSSVKRFQLQPLCCLLWLFKPPLSYFNGILFLVPGRRPLVLCLGSVSHQCQTCDPKHQGSMSVWLNVMHQLTCRDTRALHVDFRLVSHSRFETSHTCVFISWGFSKNICR